MKAKKLLTMLAAAAMTVGVLSVAASAEESEIRVAYMAKNVVDAFHVTMNAKAKECLDAMVEEGLIADWQMFDATTDPTIQVSETEEALTMGFNFFLLQPCEAAGSDPVVTRCAEEGVPIVVINSSTDSTMELASGYSGSNDVQAGEMMGNYIMEMVPDGGQYVHMLGVVGNSAQIQRGEGIAATLTEENGWELKGEYAAEWLAEKAVGFATDAITQFGDDLKAIVCDNDDMSSAVQGYCNSVGREDIVCIGVDGNKGPLTMVKEGTLGATVFQDGETQVEYAIDTIARAIITGETDGVEMFNTEIPFVLVTSENVDQYLKD